MKNEEDQLALGQFSESVNSAIRRVTDRIESEALRESEILNQKINELIAGFLEKAGLTFRAATNIEYPDGIAMDVYHLCRAVSRRASEARIKQFIEKFSDKIIQEVGESSTAAERIGDSDQ
jgi:hypothetical protein